jgi:23S rRNA pseudouridine1911/1915/1917 synthase
VGGERRPGIVHRLDKDTSGLLLVAKNDRAHRWLQEQFRNRKVEKVYLALVDGHPPTPRGRIEAPVGRDPLHRQRMAVLPPAKGREAVTEYRVVERFMHHALLEVHPVTGRTHQIRVHLAHRGWPVVGDKLYGGEPFFLSRVKPDYRFKPGETERPLLARLGLHAEQLTLVHPVSGQPVVIEAPWPRDLQAAVKQLRRYAAI